MFLFLDLLFSYSKASYKLLQTLYKSRQLHKKTIQYVR
jgi:hypothetical protein